jgi:hypothetical protein
MLRAEFYGQADVLPYDNFQICTKPMVAMNYVGFIDKISIFTYEVVLHFAQRILKPPDVRLSRRDSSVNAWLGGTFSLVSTELPMRLDFRLQCRRNWSTRAILRMIDVPLNALFECWLWRHWMFVVPL